MSVITLLSQRNRMKLINVFVQHSVYEVGGISLNR